MLPLLFAAFAHASTPAPDGPRVGDFAIYDVVMEQNGAWERSLSVTEITRFDRKNHRYLQKETRILNGARDQIHWSWKELGDVLTADKARRIVVGCEGSGGERTLAFEPAGIFPACRLPVSADDNQPYTGLVWLARVPFGLVHAELSRGQVHRWVDLRGYGRP